MRAKEQGSKRAKVQKSEFVRRGVSWDQVWEERKSAIEQKSRRAGE
jgi:hypothetical protein